MNIQFNSLLHYSLADIAERLTNSFEGYIVPIRFDPPMLAGMFRAESIDLNASRVALGDGETAGLGLIARRGFDCRLAAMAIAPRFRSKGVGRRLIQELVGDAAGRGERRMVLEVIEQNEPAVRLYESAGFQRVRRLVGFNGEALRGQTDPNLIECDLREAALAITTHAPHLPWQISGWTVGQMGSPNRAYRLGPALAVISDPTAEVVAIRGLVVPPEMRNQGLGSALLKALLAAYPGKKWRVSPVVPEAPENRVFTACGFEPDSISQLEMAMLLHRE